MENCVRIMKNHFAEKVAHTGDDNGESEREYGPMTTMQRKGRPCIHYFGSTRCLGLNSHDRKSRYQSVTMILGETIWVKHFGCNNLPCPRSQLLPSLK